MQPGPATEVRHHGNEYDGDMTMTRIIIVNRTCYLLSSVSFIFVVRGLELSRFMTETNQGCNIWTSQKCYYDINGVYDTGLQKHDADPSLANMRHAL